MFWAYKSLVVLFLIVEGRNKGLDNILEVYLFVFHLSLAFKILVHSEKGEITRICSGL